MPSGGSFVSGRRFTAGHPLIENLRRVLDEETERQAREAGGTGAGPRVP